MKSLSYCWLRDKESSCLRFWSHHCLMRWPSPSPRLHPVELRRPFCESTKKADEKRSVSKCSFFKVKVIVSILFEVFIQPRQQTLSLHEGSKTEHTVAHMTIYSSKTEIMVLESHLLPFPWVNKLLRKVKTKGCSSKRACNSTVPKGFLY